MDSHENDNRGIEILFYFPDGNHPLDVRQSHVHLHVRTDGGECEFRAFLPRILTNNKFFVQTFHWGKKRVRTKSLALKPFSLDSLSLFARFNKFLHDVKD